ncbi:MAG: cupin domain-containing protein [Spirochaetales bacterium]|nr:cupin domain-containing protein [Spirochaetales bacterium]
MVIRQPDMQSEIRDNMREGNGTIFITHILKQEEMKHCRLMATIIIPEGASIGPHRHDAETEYYILQKGTAIVVDNGKNVEVRAGDVVVTGDGESHSIRNSGKGNVEMIAVIITNKSH